MKIEVKRVNVEEQRKQLITQAGGLVETKISPSGLTIETVQVPDTNAALGYASKILPASGAPSIPIYESD